MMDLIDREDAIKRLRDNGTPFLLAAMPIVEAVLRAMPTCDRFISVDDKLPDTGRMCIIGAEKAGRMLTTKGFYCGDGKWYMDVGESYTAKKWTYYPEV